MWHGWGRSPPGLASWSCVLSSHKGLHVEEALAFAVTIPKFVTVLEKGVSRVISHRAPQITVNPATCHTIHGGLANITLKNNTCITGELIPTFSYLGPFLPHLRDNNDKNPKEMSMGTASIFFFNVYRSLKKNTHTLVLGPGSPKCWQLYHLH